jgi:hypothetical protein
MEWVLYIHLGQQMDALLWETLGQVQAQARVQAQAKVQAQAQADQQALEVLVHPPRKPLGLALTFPEPCWLLPPEERDLQTVVVAAGGFLHPAGCRSFLHRLEGFAKHLVTIEVQLHILKQHQ